MIVKIFQKAVLLCGFTTAISQMAQAQQAANPPLTITINSNDKAQVIHNIGASGCWFSEPIGKYWGVEKKERMAEALFSRKMDQNGNPRGIGLSAWRFNVGGGTAEQGDSSGIKDLNHRVECFLRQDGTYDWNKQPGYLWFLRKAKGYGVENLIAFSNTPPVQYTLNGLGYKTAKDGVTNLRPDMFNAYAEFLTEVIKHFDKEGLHFNYVSPVNEPQWDWSGKFGEAKQEGSPWNNAEIYRVVDLLNTSLQAKGITTKILTPEAGMITFLYENNTAASRQIQHFFSDTSRMSFLNLKSVPKVIVAHSYFTDSGDSNLINVRRNVKDTARKYGVEYWQSEYCMLGNGYKEGSGEKRSAMDCALFLAKVIHHDLTVGNAAAWQLWNAYEPGPADFDTRYYLIALKPDSGFRSGSFTETKNLWALGHYSLFIRPGMQRLNIQRSDSLNVIEAAQNLMVSAYKNAKGELVVVAINYTRQDKKVLFNLKNFPPVKKLNTYVTTAANGENMKSVPLKNMNDGVMLPSRSITTIVINHE